jgi:rRNA maturation endonuclease Nob1
MLNSGVTKDKYRIENTLKDFNVKSEDEFQSMVNNTWHKTRCVRCGREISLLNCHFDNGDPVCVEH